MIQGLRGYRLTAVLAATVLSVSACANMGTVLEDVLAAGALGGGSTLAGEIRSVDARRGRLQIRDDQSDRTETVNYDSRTRVLYGNREHSVTTLERGDYVRMRVDYDRDGNPWAEVIEVTESAREDDRYDEDEDYNYNGRTLRLDGTVRQVDVRRYVFTIEDSDDDVYLVYVPSRASRDDVRTFERLRRGERTRAEVRVVSRGQAELIRFR
jgi:hypothetical protein